MCMDVLNRCNSPSIWLPILTGKTHGKTMSQSDWQLRSVAKASHVPSWAAPSAPSFQDRLRGWYNVTRFIQNVSWVEETTDVPDDFVDSMLVLYFACCYYMNGLHRIISQYPSIDWSLQSPLYFVQAHRMDEDGDVVSWLIAGSRKSPQWKRWFCWRKTWFYYKAVQLRLK